MFGKYPNQKDIKIKEKIKMSFLKKFAENLKRDKKPNEPTPQGVNLQFSSFKQKEGTYSNQIMNLPTESSKK